VYLLYVALTVIQPVVLVLAGTLDFNPNGVWILGLLLIGLARGSRLAWALLLILNGFALLATAGFAIASWPWNWSAGVLVMLPSFGFLTAVLLSPQMRGHLRPYRGQASSAAPTLP
jgi:hypothetical protein